MPRELPMFPLGTVLVPHMVLPLHIFEPRYRELIQDCLAGDREFGVVLIERGHEVGGGERRSSVGTVARIIQAEELEDGRWVCVSVGVRRLRVVEWLDDDPYPRAVVNELAELVPRGDVSELHGRASLLLRRVLALQTELDEPAAPVDTELHEDPSIATFQAAALSGLNAFDAQMLLDLDDIDERFAMVVEQLEATIETLRFRLGQ